MKQNKEKRIEDIVFQTLCRVCKENKIYSYLICSISLNNYILSSINTYRNIMLSNKENPFSSCNSKTEFIDLLKTMKRNYPKDFGDARKKQMMVMDYVNALIHYCLEFYICKNNIVKIEDIGSETFEKSCKIIFGEDFKDETGVNLPQTIRDISSLDVERVKSIYNNLLSNGIIKDNTSLEEYIDKILSVPRNPFEYGEDIEEEEEEDDDELFLPF